MQFHISLLNTNARMYLYNTPRDTVAKDLMFQILCSTSTWKAQGVIPNTSNLSFHVFYSFTLNTNINTHVLQSFSLKTTSITHVLQSSSLNTKNLINHLLQGPCPIETRIYISSTISLLPIYTTNHHVHVQWGLRRNISK